VIFYFIGLCFLLYFIFLKFSPKSQCPGTICIEKLLCGVEYFYTFQNFCNSVLGGRGGPRRLGRNSENSVKFKKKKLKLAYSCAWAEILRSQCPSAYIQVTIIGTHDEHKYIPSTNYGVLFRICAAICWAKRWRRRTLKSKKEGKISKPASDAPREQA
jgi:hypothetical protein